MAGFAAAQFILELLVDEYGETKGTLLFIAGCIVLIAIIVGIAYLVSLA